jgi:hypothetical protein
MTETLIEVKELGRPIWSGHCQFPETAHPEESHARCQRHGGGSNANPARVFHPCPCHCHLGDEFDCSVCGYLLREAPMLGPDEDGDMQYVHVDEDGNLYSVECP